MLNIIKTCLQFRDFFLNFEQTLHYGIYCWHTVWNAVDSLHLLAPQSAFTSSKLTIETLEKVWNMFKVNIKDTRTTPGVVLILILNISFTPCSTVSIANFEHVNANWDKSTANETKRQLTRCRVAFRTLSNICDGVFLGK